MRNFINLLDIDHYQIKLFHNSLNMIIYEHLINLHINYSDNIDFGIIFIEIYNLK